VKKEAVSMSSPGSYFLKHFLLMTMLIAIYWAVVLAFLLIYGFTKTLGVTPSVSLSFLASFAALILGAKCFWRLAEKLSARGAEH